MRFKNIGHAPLEQNGDIGAGCAIKQATAIRRLASHLV
jgi:hypothetical protein